MALVHHIPAASLPGRIAGAIRLWLEHRRERRAQQRAMAELRGLGAAALKDLGMDRTEISSVVSTRGAGRRRTQS